MLAGAPSLPRLREAQGFQVSPIRSAPSSVSRQAKREFRLDQHAPEDIAKGNRERLINTYIRSQNSCPRTRTVGPAATLRDAQELSFAFCNHALLPQRDRAAIIEADDVK